MKLYCKRASESELSLSFSSSCHNTHLIHEENGIGEPAATASRTCR